MVIKLQCDLFSLGEIKAYKGDKPIDHPILKKLKKPNYFQTQRQFLWDYMFWLMLGSARLYIDSSILQNNSPLYWLNPYKIKDDRDINKSYDKLILSKKNYDKQQEEKIEYTYSDNTTKKIKLKNIITFFDLTNVGGNYTEITSVLDAIGQIVGNSELAHEAKNVNLFFSGKYMVGGDKSSDNQYEKPLSTPEKRSIENIVNSSKKVIAVRNQINIKRFVENIEKLKLDDAFFRDYYAIGKIYGIPKDVLEAFIDTGATYENQEKARGSHVTYTLSPKANDLCDGLLNYYNITDIELRIEWEHLPFMRVFELQEKEKEKMVADTFKTYIDAGATFESASKLLNLNLQNENKGNN